MSWGSAIGGAFGALGSSAQALASLKTTKWAARFNRDTQRYNYKRRYQWTMDDMEAAGLNPILAYQQGTGGPIGSPGASAAAMPNVGQAIAAGIGAGASATQARTQRKRLGQELEMMRAHTDAHWAASARDFNLADESFQREQVAKEVKKKTMVERQILQSQLPSARALEKFDETTLGKRLREIRRIKDALNPFGGVLGK